MKQQIVIYHDKCADGFTAAWAAWKKFGDDAEYVAEPPDGIPIDVTGKDVLVLDKSYAREHVLRMKEQARSLLILDHHLSAEKRLEGLPYAVFDMNRSGAGLAWDFLHPNTKRPWIVDYVEDRDLWRFVLPDSRNVSAWINIQEHDFSRWGEYSETNASVLGKELLRQTSSYVTWLAEHARLVSFHGYTVPLVNTPPFLASELLNRLSDGHPFAIGWFQTGTGEYQYSLRSKELDISEICAEEGGGGHAHAAGFRKKGFLFDLAQAATDAVERPNLQLAACLVLAQDGDVMELTPDSMLWSSAYRDVLALRQSADEMKRALGPFVSACRNLGPAVHTPSGGGSGHVVFLTVAQVRALLKAAGP